MKDREEIIITTEVRSYSMYDLMSKKEKRVVHVMMAVMSLIAIGLMIYSVTK